MKEEVASPCDEDDVQVLRIVSCLDPTDDNDTMFNALCRLEGYRQQDELDEQ